MVLEEGKDCLYTNEIELDEADYFALKLLDAAVLCSRECFRRFCLGENFDSRINRIA